VDMLLVLLLVVLLTNLM